MRPPLLAFSLLQLAVVAVFLGRAWQHVAHEPPIRAFFFNQQLLEGAVSWLLAMDWHSYATNLSVDAGLKHAQRLVGVFYYACAALALTLRPGTGFQTEPQAGPQTVAAAPAGRLQLWARRILCVGGVGLLLLSGCYFLDNKRQLGQALEYWSQWGAVFALVWASRFGFDEWLRRGCFVAIAMTFIGHGLYAVGYYETPGAFVTMVSRALPLADDSAQLLLIIAGVLDFAVAALLLAALAIDGQRLRSARWLQSALIYAAAWGLLTAFARVFTMVRLNFFWESFSLAHFETLVRWGHGLLPLSVLLGLVHQRAHYRAQRREAGNEPDITSRNCSHATA